MQASSPHWLTHLQQQLPFLGHRNWIAVVDSAYPQQVAPGVETLVTGEDQLAVCRAVLETLQTTPHVRPIIFTDKELNALPDADAPGISVFREGLRQLLFDCEAQSLLHEDIIRQLDEAGKTFRVLVLKTKLTLPYTSVFFRLECGYWNEASEKRLRASLT